MAGPDLGIARLGRMVAGAAAGGMREAARLTEDGARLWWRQVQWGERMLLSTLQERLTLVAPPEQPRQIAEVSAAETMAELLSRAVEQSAGEGREELFRAIVSSLVPDEARIVALLADGRSAALVHVEGRVPGFSARRVLENATLVGARASLSVPDMARAYVTKLLSAGVLEVGPEDPELASDYEILLAEREVREALSDAQFNRVPGRAVKRTLRLSVLGAELWDACRP